jgi:M6 family metalloprotease-like protein
MKKLLISLTLLFSLISIPAHANSCTRPYLLSAADQSKRTGTINVQVLFLKFADSGNKSKGYTKNWIKQLDLNEMNNYIKETSYGKAKLKFNINYSWVNMPNNSYDYGLQFNMSEEQENFFRDSIISASNVDYSKIDSVWAIPDPTLSQYYIAFRKAADVAGKKMMVVMYNESNPYLAVSEILHTLGLRDLYSNVSFNGPGGGMEQFSIMSQYYGGTSILGYEKYALGWLSAKDYVCQESGSTTHKLSSLDSKGLKLILVPINAQEMVGIEYRKKEKRDRYLGGSGILVYHIDNSLINTDKGSPINPIYFGNKKTLTFQGINIVIKKNTVTVSK